MTISSPTWVAVLASTLLCGTIASADDNVVTVYGSGIAAAKPDRAEMTVRISGSSQIAVDAMNKLLGARKKLDSSIKELGFKNLAIEHEGAVLGGPQSGNFQEMMMGGGQAPAAAKPEFSENVRLVLRDIRDLPEQELMDTLAKVLDAATDAGAQTTGGAQAAMMMQMFGDGEQSQSPVVYVVDNAKRLRKQAYVKAFQDARERAEELAEIANIDLDGVTSITDLAGQASVDGVPDFSAIGAMYGLSGATDKGDDRVVSGQFNQIRLNVRLEVRFGIK